jgi:hypothetical protein
MQRLKNVLHKKKLKLDSLPFNVEILQEEFKKIFLNKLSAHYLKKEVPEDEQINWPETMKSIGEIQNSFNSWIEELRQKEWKVFLSNETKEPERLIDYMGKLFPVSDDQIISYDDDQVVFEDKNSETGKVTLKIEEFIRRLSKHSTPYNYHRIRNFGFLSNGLKTDTLKLLREKLGTPDLNKFYVENDHLSINILFHQYHLTSCQ